jgi:hypothetical protein
VKHGRVTLYGNVDRAADRIKAEMLALGVFGVFGGQPPHGSGPFRLDSPASWPPRADDASFRGRPHERVGSPGSTTPHGPASHREDSMRRFHPFLVHPRAAALWSALRGPAAGFACSAQRERRSRPPWRGWRRDVRELLRHLPRVKGRGRPGRGAEVGDHRPQPAHEEERRQVPSDHVTSVLRFGSRSPRTAPPRCPLGRSSAR